jgi:preprotein translocase subunit SecF
MKTRPTPAATSPGTDREPPKMFRLLGETRIDFMGKRRIAFVLSALLVALGLFAAVQIFLTGQANLGIEFTGGTSVTLEFSKPVPLEEARRLLRENGFTHPQITHAEDAESFKLIVRVKAEEAPGQEAVEVADRIKRVFENAFPDNPVRDASSTSIGPAIGAELRQKAVYAILYAIIGIIAYIAVRFDFKFGVAATIAMFHDVLAVIGIMWLKNFFVPTEFTLLIMTAVLTLAGYSLTDTVVVFDRIRENLRKRLRIPLEQLINNSINQVLSRTIVTSLTTFLVVFSIFLFGGEVLRDFAFALMMGVIVGTYSSIFVASPLLLVWRGGRGKLLGRAADVPSARTQAPVKSR